jgi:hypothetical protein
LQDFSRAIVNANPFGVFGLYGGSVSKVSDVIDPLFTNADFPPTSGALTPSSAVANIYSRKYYCLLLTLVNPITLAQENKILLWDGGEWYVASQSVALIQLYTQEVNSDLIAWGTDGTSLYPLFQKPNKFLSKTLSTKLFGSQGPYMAKESYFVTVQGQNVGQLGGALNFTMSVDTEAGSYPIYSPDGTATINFGLSSGYKTGYPVLSNGLANVTGNFIGLTMTTTDADITLNWLGLSYTTQTLQMTSIGTELDPN